MIPPWIWALGVAVVILGVAYGARNQINGYLGLNHGGDMLSVKGGRPTIWWYVDDSQVNARQWLDWGNRTTREPNEPYLQICLRRARELWGDMFTIEPVTGRVAALAKLGSAAGGVPEGADRCPPALWMAWCRAAFLNRFGGLWLDGSVLPVGSGHDLYGKLHGVPALTFGTDPDEGLQAADVMKAAGAPFAGWAAIPGHPMWAGLERDLAALISEGDQSWSAPEARRSFRYLWDKHCSGVVSVDRVAEVSRDMYGRRLELDTLLGDKEWPTGSREGGMWVPFPEGRDGLERASPYLWFLRMSEDQIRESDFVWARWATKV